MNLDDVKIKTEDVGEGERGRPRIEFLDAKLQRPNWVNDTSRPSGLLWLNKNENIDPVLQDKIRAVFANVPPYAFNTYPETAKLYHKVAQLDGVPAESLLLTNGSDGAIRTTFDVFVKRGDKVLITDPSFAMYDVYCKIFGVEQLLLKYRSSDAGPVLDFDELIETVRREKPQLVCLPNPDSPTGTIVTHDQVKQLLRTAQESRSMVLIDEAYHLFYPHTVIQLTKEFSNLLVSRTFSKAWGVAGLRVGYLVANPELMQLIHKNRPMYEVSTLSSELLYLWLDHKSEVLKSVGRLLLGKQQFVEAMTGMGFSCPVSHGNFVHVKFDSFESRAAELLRDVVLYRSSYPSGNCLHGYSRFSLGTPEQMETIANRLKWGAV